MGKAFIYISNTGLDNDKIKEGKLPWTLIFHNYLSSKIAINIPSMTPPSPSGFCFIYCQIDFLLCHHYPNKFSLKPFIYEAFMESLMLQSI